MPRTNKIITPKGSRYPGSGRAKGKPNPISVEVRQLVGELVNNPRYQLRLRQDFERRKVHPTIESLIWTYHLGKPRQDIALTASVDVTGRLDEERRIFASLDIRDLEQLAAESQALVNRAQALAKTSVGTVTPPPVVPDTLQGKGHAESLDNCHGSDKNRYDNLAQPDEKIADPPNDNGPEDEIPS